MRLQEAGEFGVIERITRALGASAGGARRTGNAGLVTGIGDDAAIWDLPASALIATTDMLVEGVHFDLALTGWEDLGWKALAVNLSDVAAMGAAPAFALVSLALRQEVMVEDVEALYAGIGALASDTGCLVAGGDTVGTRSAVVLNVAVLGSVPADERDTLLRRDRGMAGDLVAVTGVLGASAAGLLALQRPSSQPFAHALYDAHRRPQPRLAAGQALRAAGVRCAMDVSDGLLADLEKMCRASGTGAHVRAGDLPLSPEARALYPEHALELAATGGEDYELLFTAPAPMMERALDAVREGGVPATVIGRLTQEAGVQLMGERGEEVQLRARGWDHFGKTV